MKKNVLFISVFVLGIQLTCTLVSAQSGGNKAPCDDTILPEVDCIARYYLGNANTKDLQLKSVTKGYAGIYVKYDKVRSGIRVFRAETMVILKDDRTLNALKPDTLDTRVILQDPVINVTEEFARDRLLTTRPDIVSADPLGIFWIKPEADWLVAFAFLAYIPTQPHHDIFFVDAGESTIYKKGWPEYIRIPNKKMEGNVKKDGE